MGEAIEEMCFRVGASWHSSLPISKVEKKSVVSLCPSPVSQQHLKLLLCKREKDEEGINHRERN